MALALTVWALGVAVTLIVMELTKFRSSERLFDYGEEVLVALIWPLLLVAIVMLLPVVGLAWVVRLVRQRFG